MHKQVLNGTMAIRHGNHFADGVGPCRFSPV